MKDYVSRRTALKMSGMMSMSYLMRSPFPHSDLEKQALVECGKINVGIIGFGIRGEQLLRAAGFPTIRWLDEHANTPDFETFSNQRDLGIRITGICDLYDKRAINALKAAGKSAVRFKNYKELINSKNVDAVIIATPDHLHAPMVLEAANCGKHVYVEKCFTHQAQEVVEVYQAVKASGITFQLGHQLRQKDSYHKASDILYLDILGKVSLIQCSTNRNTANGAWVYDIPEDADETNIDWVQFDSLREFDNDRFFRWRKYWDYGTGLAGDLLTHEFDSVNSILNLGIPYSAVASGGIYHFKDGREVPDVFQVSYEYPERGLTLLYSATLANDTNRQTMVMGSDATLFLGNQIAIFPSPNSKKYAHKLSSGVMKSDEPFFQYPSKKEEADKSVDAVSGATSAYFKKKGMVSTYKDGEEIDPTHLHLMEWILCIRNGWETSCNIESAFQEAITAHMATLSYKTGKKTIWDEKQRKIVW